MPKAQWIGLLALGTAYLLSRWLLVSIGVTFDASPLTWYWQYLDPSLMMRNLPQALLYLHNQPPLYNLYLGTIWSLGHPWSDAAYHLSHILFGLAMTMALYLVQIRLGVPLWLSAFLTMAFMVSPACILHESLLLYTYPIAAALCVAALFLNEFIDKKSFGSGLVAFSLMAIVTLIRPFYHLLWLVLVIVATGALCFFSGDRKGLKKLIICSLMPLIMVVAVYAKNAILFGSFSAASWAGANLSCMTVLALPVQERESLISRGQVSELALYDPFKPLKSYPPKFAQREVTGIPVLDQVSKEASGAPNFNNKAYLAISRQYMKDSLTVLRLHPEIYFDMVRKSYSLFLESSSNYGHLPPADKLILHQWENLYDALFLTPSDISIRKGTFGNAFSWLVSKLARRSPLLVAGFHILVLWGIYKVWLLVKGPNRDLPSAATILFITLTIVYGTVTTVLLSAGEGNRGRFEMEPLLMVLLGTLIGQIIVAGKKQKTDNSTDPRAVAGAG